MIFLLLLLLRDADDESIDIFNTLQNEKKLIILTFLKQVFLEDFQKEIALYKRIHKAYEAKRVELTILYEFGLEQGYIDEVTSMFEDIDYKIFTNFEDM